MPRRCDPQDFAQAVEDDRALLYGEGEPTPHGAAIHRAAVLAPAAASPGPGPGQQRLSRWLEGPAWPWLAAGLDLSVLVAAVLLSLGWTSWMPALPALLALLAFPFAATLAMLPARTRARRLDAGVLDDLWPVIAAVSVAGMLTSALGSLLAAGGIDEPTLVGAWAIAVGLLVLSHFVVRVIRRRLRGRGLCGRPTLIVGAGVVGARIGRWLHTRPQYGLRPVGFLDWSPPQAELVGGRPVPVLGKPSDLTRIVRETRARHVVLAFAGRPDRQLIPLVRACGELGVQVSMVPRLFEHTNDRMTYEPVGGMPLLAIGTGRPRGAKLAAKHGLDRVVGSILLLGATPLMAVIALSILVTAGRPVVFRQRRIGHHSREFGLLKFCSMRGADPDPGDPPDLMADQAPGGIQGPDRRTAIGRLLRRSSLDELMQLVNVARGEMSLVGPRPERPEYVELFSDSLDRYTDRHRVRPGITGLAQVGGLRGGTSLAERIELDNYYIEHWSFTLDAKILLRTVLAAFHVPE